MAAINLTCIVGLTYRKGENLYREYSEDDLVAENISDLQGQRKELEETDDVCILEIDQIAGS